MTTRLDIRIHVDGVPPLHVATDRVSGGWIALPVGALWCDGTRHENHDEAVEAAVQGSIDNVQRLLRGEGTITITQEQADEIMRQVYEGLGRPMPGELGKQWLDVPESIKRPTGQLDLFGRSA